MPIIVIPSISSVRDRRFSQRSIVAFVFIAWLTGCAVQPPKTVSLAPTSTRQSVPERWESTVSDHADPEPETPTMISDDLWHRIVVEFHMTPQSLGTIETAMQYYARNKSFVSAATARAQPYLFFIYTEIEKRRLPLEIALLPIIESGYNPRATSSEGAAGIWQLMPSTGHRFDLHQSRWYDARRDVVASTHAALDYLEELRDRFFGDWALALAAYNCGARTVERAIERNRRARRPTDFWSLDLPRETENYVPRLFALVEILSHPEAHDVAIANIEHTPHFKAIDIGGGLELARVIEWSQMNPKDFDALNAAFRTRFSIDGAPTTVLVHNGVFDEVSKALKTLTAADRRAPRRHVVAAGETLSHIAADNGVSIASIKRANGIHGSIIHPGQDLLIPNLLSIYEAGEEITSAVHDQTHVVVLGDTLWDIAQRYRTTTSTLAKLNQLDRKAILRPGRELRLPGHVTAGSDGKRLAYEVKQGDSLWRISRRFNVSISDLRRWNRLSDKRYLQPGQKLIVYLRNKGRPAQKI